METMREIERRPSHLATNRSVSTKRPEPIPEQRRVATNVTTQRFIVDRTCTGLTRSRVTRGAHLISTCAVLASVTENTAEFRSKLSSGRSAWSYSRTET